jgi:hypothetical protein
MKKIMSIIAFMAISGVVFSQITDIKISDEITIDKIYAGSLSGTQFHTDSLYASGFTGVRFGAMATYKPASWVSFSTWAMVQVDGGAIPWSLQQFYTTLSPTKKLTLQIGSMASIPTEQRPHPVSAGGQFETWSESQIPGGGIGTKVKYQVSKDVQLASGIVVRKGMPEYSGRITYKKIQLSGWYSQCDTSYGAAMTVDFKKVYSTLVWKEGVIADVLTITLDKKYAIYVYSDIGYDVVNKDLLRCELGVYKSFDSQWIDGLVSLGWDQQKKSLQGYLFIHL